MSSHTYTYPYSRSKTIPYCLLDSAVVDGVEWYTVQCNESVGAWIRAQNSGLYYNHSTYGYHDAYQLHSDNIFDIHRSLYIMLGLVWS